MIKQFFVLSIIVFLCTFDISEAQAKDEFMSECGGITEVRIKVDMARSLIDPGERAFVQIRLKACIDDLLSQQALAHYNQATSESETLGLEERRVLLVNAVHIRPDIEMYQTALNEVVRAIALGNDRSIEVSK